MRLRVLALTTLFAVGASAGVAAQGGPGAIDGVAKTEEDSTPIQFALVRLVPADPKSTAGQQGITSAQGRFRFSSVVAGDYMLELLRIGYPPVVSAIQVRAGETLHADLRGSLRPFPLPTVMVYPEGACLNSAELAMDSYLSAIWEEIRDGVEIRRGFEQRYRYSLGRTEITDIRIPSRPDQHRQKSDTVINEPDSFLAREAQRRARRQAEGYGKGNNVALPDEKELLDETFLREHCVVPVVQDADGATGLRFRQAVTPRGGFGLQGIIWVDASTRLMRRLELEYLDGDKPFSHAVVDYADLAVAGGTLRLQASGSYSARLLRAPSGTVATGTLKFSYWGFEEVRAR